MRHDPYETLLRDLLDGDRLLRNLLDGIYNDDDTEDEDDLYE